MELQSGHDANCSMSGGNSTNWRTLLDDKKARFRDCGCEIPLIPAEPRFVEAFEALCREQKQLYYTRLLGGLKLNKTAAFARAVDRGCQHVQPNTVSALVYGATFVVVKVLSDPPGCPIRSFADRLTASVEIWL